MSQLNIRHDRTLDARVWGPLGTFPRAGERHKVPCPDFGQFDDAVLDEAATEFGRRSGLGLLPAYRAAEDETRTGIDCAVSTMPGVHDYGTDDLTKMRCAEPSVQGDKLAARLQPNITPYLMHGREADLPGDSGRLLQRRAAEWSGPNRTEWYMTESIQYLIFEPDGGNVVFDA